MNYFNFQNSYQSLPEKFFERVNPAQMRNPEIILFNQLLANDLDLDPEISLESLAPYLSGNKLFPSSDPIALAYAGHQFGYFVPTLGDGRAHLLGEHVTKDLRRYDIQLKGSGRTSFSRRGDGLCALGPALREYLISEALFYLNIKTTRTLAVISCDENVIRERESKRALSVRIAKNHIRVGTFEYFFARRDFEGIKLLADYTIEREFKNLLANKHEKGEIYLHFLDEVIKRQAALIAKWSSVGFIHGVMNTDNMLICGDTIDFGPCAFMDHYDPMTCFSSIDRDGRYAYANQPVIAKWNLSSFAQTLFPLIDEDESEAIVEKFQRLYEISWNEIFAKKLGFIKPTEEVSRLVVKFLEILQDEKVDFTKAFRELGKDHFLTLFQGQERIKKWIKEWRGELALSSLSEAESQSLRDATNPFVIPRNHQVERAILRLVDDGEIEYAVDLLKAIRNPFEENEYNKNYAEPPSVINSSYKTFCGT